VLVFVVADSAGFEDRAHAASAERSLRAELFLEDVVLAEGVFVEQVFEAFA